MSDDPMTELARINAAADLVMSVCPHCDATLEINAMIGHLPRAVGITHERGCPDWLPDWPR